MLAQHRQVITHIAVKPHRPIEVATTVTEGDSGYLIPMEALNKSAFAIQM